MFESLLNTTAIMQYFIFAGIIVLPFFVMLRRAGFNPLWAAVLFIPYTGLFVVMGVMAFKRWPVEPEKVKKDKIKNG